MIKKILIANRAEIACRVIKTCKQLGVTSVAVYSAADAAAQHVKLADQAVTLGEAEAKKSYLNIEKIIKVAKRLKCDAVHPGYGFLSENSNFAERLKKEKIIFIGPSPKVMDLLGDKIHAKELAAKTGVPLVPGLLCKTSKPEQLEQEILSFANKSGLPILIKAAAGGGGRGMRKVSKLSELSEALASAQREAQAAFGDPRLFVERLIDKARHIEVQIIGDKHGNIFSLHDRDCTMQRNHQKVIEEAPAPNVPDKLRQKIHAAARKLCKAAGYYNAGTVEFLLDSNSNFYFLEVNSRLQVEHPVTESILGIDLVELQIKVADGLDLSKILKKQDLQPTGHAIECRICAEIPEQNFIASTGKIEIFNTPKDINLRLDTGFTTGDSVSHYYDSLIAKLVIYRRTRDQAITDAISALAKINIAGLSTNSAFLLKLLRSSEFSEVSHHTNIAQSLLAKAQAKDLQQLELMAAAYHCYRMSHKSQPTDIWQTNSCWSLLGPREQTAEYALAGHTANIKIRYDYHKYSISSAHHKQTSLEITSLMNNQFEYEVAGKRSRLEINCLASGVWLSSDLGCFKITQHLPKLKSHIESQGMASGSISSPLPGKIVALKAQPGTVLEAGDAILVLESMKMEHVIRAPMAAKIAQIHVAVGDIVDAQAVLIDLASADLASA